MVSLIYMMLCLSFEVHGQSRPKRAKKHQKILQDVGRVVEIFQANEVLLDTPRTDEAIEDVDASSLIIGSTSTSTTERLLANNSTSALLVVVHIACGVPELVSCGDQRLAVLREAEIGC